MNNGVVKILGSKQLQWLARISHKPLQGDDFPGKLEFEPAAMALIQLKEERISHFRAVSADLPKDSHGNEALQLHLQQISERKLHMQHVETRAFAPVLGLYDEYPRSIKEQEVSQKREPGQTSTCRPDSCSAPSSRSFLGGTTKDSLVETTYSLGGGEEEKSRRGWTWIPRRTPDHAIQVYDSPTLFSKRKILAFILNFQLCEWGTCKLTSYTVHSRSISCWLWGIELLRCGPPGLRRVHSWATFIEVIIIELYSYFHWGHNYWTV